jgi:hypothetical protein
LEKYGRTFYQRITLWICNLNPVSTASFDQLPGDCQANIPITIPLAKSKKSLISRLFEQKTPIEFINRWFFFWWRTHILIGSHRGGANAA